MVVMMSSLTLRSHNLHNAEELLRQASRDDTITSLVVEDVPTYRYLWDTIHQILVEREDSFEVVEVSHCTGSYLLEDWTATNIKTLMLQSVTIPPSLVLPTKNLQTLSLTSLSLSVDVAASLARQLASTPCSTTLQCLDLSDTLLSANCVAFLARGIYNVRSLKYIYLSDCNLMDDQVAEILFPLHHHPAITELDISFNKCRSAGMEALVGILNTAPTLSKLTMGFQAFGAAKVLDLTPLIEALAVNTHLKELDLGGNSIRDKDFLSLVGALCRNSTLQVLDLSENRITNKGISFLAQRLSHLPESLRLFILEANRFDDTGLDMLSKSFSCNSKKSHRHRSNFSLVDMGLDDEDDFLGSEAVRRVTYWLDLNFGGRCLLQQPQDEEIPISLWPTILARANNLTESGLTPRQPVAADIIYYFLLQGPELVQR